MHASWTNYHQLLAEREREREREREMCCFFLSDLCEVDHVVSIQKIMKIVTHNRRDQAIITLFL